MCLTVLYISFILCAIRLNHAAEPQNPSAFLISATTSKQPQVFPMVSGSNFTLFTFYNLSDAAAGRCNGTCQALNTSHTERIDGENCKVDIENGIPTVKVIISTAVSDSFIGIWRCTLRTPSVYRPGTMSIQNAEFRVFVTPTGWNPELPKTPPRSYVSVNVENTKSTNVILEEGQIFGSLNITGNFNEYHDYTSCDMICEIVLHEPVKSTSCSVHNTNILAELNSTKAYEGLWNCTVKLKKAQQPSSGQQAQNDVQQSPIHATLYISVKAKETAALGLSKETILIAIAVSTIVVLIIIGQTICIIHFKKKANRAQIDKNLMPKNTINEGSFTDRYVKKSGQTESGKGEVDEGIYEALEPARDEPPPLPPLATLPGTPIPQHLLRSASQSNLVDGTGARTTPRPPRSNQNPGRFNTVARSSSIERIKKRPPQPLPSESEIYEVVTPENVSPMIKHKLFGMKSSPPGPSTGPPTKSNRSAPGKPLPGFTNTLESLKPPGSNVARPPIAHKFPATAKPMGGMSMLPPVASGAKPMGGMPILPSMISAANLKPVNKPKPPPVTERPTHPQTLLTPPSTSAKPYKPKPPVPLPEPVKVEPEPIPEDFESVISDDSDDEFKRYDVLPDYNIYENGPY